jgi:hypothetical protein
MNKQDPLNQAINILNRLPALPSPPVDKHLTLIDSAIVKAQRALPSIHVPEQIMLVNFILAELTLMKGYVAASSHSPDRKANTAWHEAFGPLYFDEVLRLVKTGLEAIQFTAFAGIDAMTLYISEDWSFSFGEDREWDTKHLLAHYNALFSELEQLKTARDQQRRELYLCCRLGLRQMFSIASTIAENRYPN